MLHWSRVVSASIKPSCFGFKFLSVELFGAQITKTGHKAAGRQFK